MERLRERDAGQQIEDASTLPDGTTVAGAAGLRSLLLQLIILALIVFALARPLFPWQVAGAHSLVLIIDPSVSMTAMDDPAAPAACSLIRPRPWRYVLGLFEKEDPLRNKVRIEQWKCERGPSSCLSLPHVA